MQPGSCAAVAPATLACTTTISYLPPTFPSTVQVPESLRARRVEVVSRLKSLEGAVRPITEFLSNEENVKLLKQDKTQNQTFLQKEFGIGGWRWTLAWMSPPPPLVLHVLGTRAHERTRQPTLSTAPRCLLPCRRCRCCRRGAGGRPVPLCQVEL